MKVDFDADVLVHLLGSQQYTAGVYTLVLNFRNPDSLPLEYFPFIPLIPRRKGTGPSTFWLRCPLYYMFRTDAVQQALIMVNVSPLRGMWRARYVKQWFKGMYTDIL
ncbi:hypothetical protein PM082_003988 [Marasmius tenuissimus]|nr:hypothetical protein PM082_003988 [Marasmius tenuissimus]